MSVLRQAWYITNSKEINLGHGFCVGFIDLWEQTWVQWWEVETIQGHKEGFHKIGSHLLPTMPIHHMPSNWAYTVQGTKKIVLIFSRAYSD